MFVKLIRHHFPDEDVEWEVVDVSVPLGTIYEVLGYDRDMVMFDALTGRHKHVECFLLSGNGDVGFLPTCLFEAVEYERDNANSRNPAN